MTSINELLNNLLGLLNKYYPRKPKNTTLHQQGVVVTDDNGMITSVQSLSANSTLITGLSDVATSGDYRHLSNTPTKTSDFVIDNVSAEGNTSTNNSYKIGEITIGSTTSTFYGVDTNTTYTNGTGITIDTSNGNKINHSNNVVKQDTQALYKIKYDTQGHITSGSTVTTSDLPNDQSYTNIGSNLTNQKLVNDAINTKLGSKLESVATSNINANAVTLAKLNSDVYDDTDGGTSGSSKLITSGAVYNGSSGKLNNGVTVSGSTSIFTATISGLDTPVHGTVITLYNNIGDNAANAKLNVNNKGAKDIYYKSSKITAGQYPRYTTALFMYNTKLISDNPCWQMVYTVNANYDDLTNKPSVNATKITSLGTSQSNVNGNVVFIKLDKQVICDFNFNFESRGTTSAKLFVCNVPEGFEPNSIYENSSYFDNDRWIMTNIADGSSAYSRDQYVYVTKEEGVWQLKVSSAITDTAMNSKGQVVYFTN